jgi:hypothetical protein
MRRHGRMMMRTYAGIGARATPEPILQLMTRCSFTLAKRGYLLRSGHADGADSAFEAGAGTNAEIYLPAPRWRGSPSPLHPEAIGAAIWHQARIIAAQHHPAFATLSEFIQHLHTRNVFQVLGPKLNSPSEFVLCWTPTGEPVGGTGQAIRIAHAHNVPVFNLQRTRERTHVEKHLGV